MGDDGLTPRDRPPTRRAFLAASGVVAAGALAAGVGAVIGSQSEGARSLVRSTRVAPLPVSLPELHGTDNDASSALMELLDRSGPQAEIRGDYVLDHELTVPHHIAQLSLGSDTVLRIRGDHPGVSRLGTITFREVTGKAMMAGSTQVPVASPKEYSAGEYLLLSGADVVSRSFDRYGYLRRVLSVENDTIEIDAPLPRTIEQTPRTSLVELAPPLWLTGEGMITSTDASSMFSALVRFIAVQSPRATGITVAESGATGISVSHCEGGEIVCTIADLLDDGEKHFGYGVNVSGSTRGLRVGGRISRVRHAVTTNAGPLIDGVGNAGEPEDCVFAPLAVDCTNKSVDTHRVGWGIVIVPHVMRGNGGVQIRADNATVVGGSITGCTGPGITVSSRVSIPATIASVTITDLAAGQTGILCKGPARIVDPAIDLSSGTGIFVEDDSSVVGGSVTGQARQGLVVGGTRNTVTGLVIGRDVRVKVVESAAPGENELNPVIR